MGQTRTVRTVSKIIARSSSPLNRAVFQDLHHEHAVVALLLKLFAMDSEKTLGAPTDVPTLVAPDPACIFKVSDLAEV